MSQRKHFVQWMAVTVLYWAVAYVVANLVSYIVYVFAFFSQPAGIRERIGLLFSNLMWAFLFNQFWDIDIVVIISSSVVWVLLLTRRLYLRTLVVALWSSFVVACLYLANGILISLHSFQESYYDLFFIRHLVSSTISPLLLRNILESGKEGQEDT
jgi:hypothetical protein